MWNDQWFTGAWKERQSACNHEAVDTPNPGRGYISLFIAVPFASRPPLRKPGPSGRRASYPPMLAAQITFPSMPLHGVEEEIDQLIWR